MHSFPLSVLGAPALDMAFSFDGTFCSRTDFYTDREKKNRSLTHIHTAQHSSGCVYISLHRRYRFFFAEREDADTGLASDVDDYPLLRRCTHTVVDTRLLYTVRAASCIGFERAWFIISPGWGATYPPLYVLPCRYVRGMYNIGF